MPTVDFDRGQVVRLDRDVGPFVDAVAQVAGVSLTKARQITAAVKRVSYGDMPLLQRNAARHTLEDIFGHATEDPETGVVYAAPGNPSPTLTSHVIAWFPQAGWRVGALGTHLGHALAMAARARAAEEHPPGLAVLTLRSNFNGFVSSLVRWGELERWQAVEFARAAQEIGGAETDENRGRAGYLLATTWRSVHEDEETRTLFAMPLAGEPDPRSTIVAWVPYEGWRVGELDRALTDAREAPAKPGPKPQNIDVPEASPEQYARLWTALGDAALTYALHGGRKRPDAFAREYEEYLCGLVPKDRAFSRAVHEGRAMGAKIYRDPIRGHIELQMFRDSRRERLRRAKYEQRWDAAMEAMIAELFRGRDWLVVRG